MPIGKGWSAVKDLIGKAASMVGVDPILLAAIGAIESAFNPSAKAGTSSASGLFQFISSTWQTMLRKYGPKYDIPPNTPQTDPRASALMGAEFIKENVAALKGVKGTITPTDVYLAHFLGPGGAKQLLKADPGTDAVALMPGPAAANRSIFFNNKDGSHRTVAQVYAEIGRRVQLGLKQTGVTTGAADVASAPVKTGKGAGAADTTARAPAPGASGVSANATNALAATGPAKPASPASAKAPSPATGAAAIAPGLQAGMPGMTGVGGAGSATAASVAGAGTASKPAPAGATIPVSNISQGGSLTVVPRQPAFATASTRADTADARTGLGGALSNVASKIPFAGGSPAAPFGFGPASVKLIDQGPKSIMTIQRAQHDEHMDALGGVGETLDRSLKVHEQALDVLRAMYDLMQQAVKQGAGSAGTAAVSAGTSATTVAGTVQPFQRGMARAMPTPPVSMARTA
ncbi:hypothetical protein P3T23_009568 [Paraburkholderia sp. GAS448]|uniref:transglycosylase SLT domain-containing protein n=1 Tax=Paraburkholderia sp. GAS448 TaxID=3035136 RepID=UPI003D23199B